MSHDLRTPLTLVSGPVEQVAGVDYLTPRDKSLMNIALKNIHILRRLINHILDFRKYENGKVELTEAAESPDIHFAYPGPHADGVLHGRATC